jgi:hypothetical protein
MSADTFDLPADFENHHIEGYAVALQEQGKDARFSAPLISHIDGNLWSGGCIDGVALPADFVHVVSLYPWEKYALSASTTRHEYRIYDSHVMESDQFTEAVESTLRGLAKGPTLVHCQAGLNRSGVVSALVLIHQGRTPADAVALLREKRSRAVLCNTTFEAFVLNGGAP